MNYTQLDKTVVKYSHHDALNAATVIAKERNMERNGPPPPVSKEVKLTLEGLNQQTETMLRNNFKANWTPRSSNH